jgi:MFS family permease
VRLIASRRFGPYFAGNALSASGTWFQSLAASLLIYRLTGSEFLLGVLSFAQFAPTLFLAPWSGAAADRFDRRRLLLVTQPAAAVLSAMLALVAAVGIANAGVVITLALAGGVASAFSTPSQQALIASLVEPADIASAVALNSMTFNIARAVGPVGAAAAVETLGIPAAFAINACSYLLFTIALLFLRPRAQERAEGTRLRDSLRLVIREPRLAAFLLIVAAVGFASDPINTLSPAFAQAFGHADTAAGVIVGVFGAGAVTAAFVLVGRTAGSGRRTAATLLVLGTGVIAFAVTPWLPVALTFLFAGGVGYLASNTAATSRLQLEVAESQRGRIMALWSIAFLGLRPFASLVDGAIAGAVGVRTAGVVLALPALAAAGVLAVLVRRGR